MICVVWVVEITVLVIHSSDINVIYAITTDGSRLGNKLGKFQFV